MPWHAQTTANRPQGTVHRDRKGRGNPKRQSATTLHQPLYLPVSLNDIWCWPCLKRCIICQIRKHFLGFAICHALLTLARCFHLTVSDTTDQSSLAPALFHLSFLPAHLEASHCPPIPSRSRCLESPPPGVPVEGSKIITAMILELEKAIKLELWKFGYMSFVVVWIDFNRSPERSLLWSAEKGSKSWWGPCPKVQNMFGISIPGFGRSRCSFSNPGGVNVARFETFEKRS